MFSFVFFFASTYILFFSFSELLVQKTNKMKNKILRNRNKKGEKQRCLVSCASSFSLHSHYVSFVLFSFQNNLHGFLHNLQLVPLTTQIPQYEHFTFAFIDCVANALVVFGPLLTRPLRSFWPMLILLA